MINIAIADDHHILLEGLAAFLNKFCEFKVVLLALNGEILIAELYRLQERNVSVDIILMDINMLEIDGIEASKIVKMKFPGIKILILTMFDDIKLVKETLKAGVDGYVVKQIGKSELAAAIKSVMKGEVYFCKHIQAKIDERKSRGIKDYLDYLKINSISEISKINIAIAEDHQVMIDGLTVILERFGVFKVVLAANNGQILIDKLYKLQETNVSVDIVLMDINMPEMKLQE